MTLSRGGAIDDAVAILRLFEMMDQGASRHAASWAIARVKTSDPFEQRNVAGRLQKKVAAMLKAKAAQ